MKHILLLFLLLNCLVTNAQINVSFLHDGLQRSGLVYIPQQEPPAGGWPVVFVLHGFTQTAQGIMGYSGMNSVAEEENFIVCYPNGINFSWNVGFTTAATDDVNFIETLIDSLSASWLINQQRVYACGMSNGGFMSYRLACELSNKIAAIASVTGSMTAATFNSCTPGRAIPVLNIHGTADAVVPYAGSNSILPVPEVIQFWRNNNGCPAAATISNLPDVVSEGSYVEKQLYTPCSNGSSLEHLRIVGGGHTWPGSSGLSGIGNTNRDISASREIWRFFSQYDLSGTISSLSRHSTQVQTLLASPNPTNGPIRLDWPLTQPAMLAIYNSQGQLVRRQHCLPAPFTQIDPLPAPGLYYLQAVATGGERWAGSILVQ
jgi:polyhydroxybutyrate depolymerase